MRVSASSFHLSRESMRRALQQQQPNLLMAAPCCSTSMDAQNELQLSDLLVAALRRVARKQKRTQPVVSMEFLGSSDLDCRSSGFDLQSRQRRRLNWNPLACPARQLSVRHNTQPAQPSASSATKTQVPPATLLPVPQSTPTVPATSNARRAFLVDTLAVMRRLEAQQLSPRQAEAITSVVTTVLNDSLETVAQAYTSKSDMQKSEMIQEATLSKFKAEMQSSLEHHFATLQREAERLRTDMEKMRSELRYEIDKVQANQRLDLNLERGHIRDELNKQQSETSNLTNKLDREIHTLKTQLEAAKYDVIKYCIGTIVSVTAVGLGLLRIIM